MKLKLILIGVVNLVLFLVFILCYDTFREIRAAVYDTTVKSSFLSSFSKSSSTFEKKFVSPEKKYEVTIKQTDQGADLFHSWHVIDWNVVKDGQPYIENQTFRKDGAYTSQADSSTWEAENVLRFEGIEWTYSAPPDEIFVINQSNLPVRYLKVNAGNNFWLFDVMPGTTTKMLASQQTDHGDGLSWIAASGKFDEIKKIPYSGVNFRVHAKTIDPSHYCIFITDDGLEIKSKEFKEYNDHSANDIKVNIAGSPCQ